MRYAFRSSFCDCFAGSNPIGIISETEAGCTIRCCCHLAAVLPGEVPAIVVSGWITDGIVVDGTPVIRRQKIPPTLGVTVGIASLTKVLAQSHLLG